VRVAGVAVAADEAEAGEDAVLGLDECSVVR
jgi:hypothetical protein